MFSFRVIDKRTEEKDTVVTNGNFIKIKGAKVHSFEYEKQIGKADRAKNQGCFLMQEPYTRIMRGQIKRSRSKLQSDWTRRST